MKLKQIAVMGLRGFPGVQGGVEKHCEALYPHISGMHFRVYCRRPYMGAVGASYPEINFVTLPSTRIGGFEAVFHTLLSALHASFVSRPQLVHIHNIGPGLFTPLLRLMGLPVVVTYHSVNYEHQKWGRMARGLFRLGEWCTMRFARKVIFVNRRMYNRLSPKYPGKCVYLPNGVNQPQVAESTHYLDSLGLLPRGYVLSVGRLTPEKGFEYLVEAVQKLPADVVLVIAGGSDHDGRYAERLRQLDLQGRVVFTGNVQGEQLAQLYSHARLYVLSSVNEGFPLVLLEAMSYGLPILASDIPATDIPQMRPGDFFAAANAQALARAIEVKLAEPFALQHYDLTPYSWVNIAAQTAQVLRSARK